MRQLVQSVRSGELRIVDAPDPVIGPTEVLVATTHSLVSAGTERAVRKLASASLLQKARARPDLVKQVIRKARAEGVRSTFNTVQSRLDDDMPLGYSASGIAVEVGEYVSGVRPGMRVATGGAGHGDLQVVAGNLTVALPEAVELSDAAFATVASIALHGLRLADVGPGGKVCVIGLGLIGQLTVRLALASGLDVVGIDLRDWAAQRATDSGALGLVELGEATTRVIRDWSRGRGVDAVLLTAATTSSEPTRRATAIARDRATIVVVGDVGMELERTPLYEKELTVKVARSYGPGRYERAYEDWAIDYPIGHVRWTEGRNLEAVLDLLASGRLKVEDLVTHRYDFSCASEAYNLLSEPGAQYLGIQLDYPSQRSTYRPRAQRGTLSPGPNDRNIGVIGAGNFARGVLVPAIKESGFGTIRAVASARGTSAVKLADQLGANAMTTDEMLADESLGTVVIATSHDTHAELTIRALEAGKHVFCEKPLAITEDELNRVEAAWRASGKRLQVGFNRRHSPMLKRAKEILGDNGGPLAIIYRISAGELPEAHWFNDRRQAGRLIGEACHFIDTCNALAGHPPASVQIATGDSSRREALLSHLFGLAVEYPCGSIAMVLYVPGGHPGTPKERIEIVGRGHTIAITDYRQLVVDGKEFTAQGGKGHVEQFQQATACRERDTQSALITTRAILETVASLVGQNDQPRDLFFRYLRSDTAETTGRTKE
jgi:predicted dehydrogenase/threonine dehydrogenase-like Zn-dependent dehydrogenase